MRAIAVLVIGLALSWGCDAYDFENPLDLEQPAIGSNADPSPGITFNQVARTVGIDRSNEPPSAGTFTSAGTLAYGGWLADLDNDTRLDYYAVNHGQNPHRSGLFINNGTGGFGKNLFTVSLEPSQASFPNLGISNEMRFVGDLTGDGRVDLFFLCWSGLGVLCVNQGVVTRSDWTGPGYLCFGTADGIAFADVNQDGKTDVLSMDLTNFDAYTAYYSQTASYFWRLNNGNTNIQTWPTTTNFLSLRVTDPSSPAAPFVDLNNDTIPDKIVGIPQAAGNRGPNGTAVAGQRVFVGQANGTYAQRTGTGLDGVTQPITRIEDVNDDGCLDVGTDPTGYRDNQNWFVQNKSGSTCSVTFTATPRTAFPYYPGFKRYNVDIDNSGLLSKAVIIHKAYGTNDGRTGGVTLFRKLPNGSFTAISPTQSGININGTSTSEFYADNLTPGDWNDDGRPDFAGTGTSTIANSDAGFALWTSALATANSWIKVRLPSVTGFFTGAATIEVFDAGFVGDSGRLVTPPIVLYTGRAWATQVYHVGIGMRSAVDVRVRFPDGRQTVRAGVTPASRITVEPVAGIPPTAVATASPTSVSIGQAVSFDGTASSDPDGSIASFLWNFGDGTQATTATASHAYSTAGTFAARLTVTDNSGASDTEIVTITVADATPPSIAITGAVFTPTVSDNIGVVKVEWYFDGGLSATATTPPFSYSLNLTPIAGQHTITARAFDAAGNTTVSTAVLIQD